MISEILKKNCLKTGDSENSDGDSSLPRAFEIDFEETPFGGEGRHSFPPEICWETCKLVYPNASLALVTLNHGLSCYCAVGETVSHDILGPSRFCNRNCGGQEDSASSSCGGEHQFEDGTKEEYAAIYCIPGTVRTYTN